MTRRKIAIIHIGGRNGEVIDLIVHENDDPMILAKTFLQDQQLPAKLLPLILQKIAESVLEATRKQMSRPSASVSSEGNAEQEYERARNSALSSAVDDLKRRSMPNKQLLSASSFSLGTAAGGGSRPRSSSAGSRASRSRGQQKQEAIAEQMLEVAHRYDRHKEELKRNLERDQEESLARADFRSHLRASPSRWRAHVSHARNSNRGDDPFDGLYRLHEDQVRYTRVSFTLSFVSDVAFGSVTGGSKAPHENKSRKRAFSKGGRKLSASSHSANSTNHAPCPFPFSQCSF